MLESFKPVIAQVDETKISLAFSNLIENAVKYNKEGRLGACIPERGSQIFLCEG